MNFNTLLISLLFFLHLSFALPVDPSSGSKNPPSRPASPSSVEDSDVPLAVRYPQYSKGQIIRRDDDGAPSLVLDVLKEAKAYWVVPLPLSGLETYTNAVTTLIQTIPLAKNNPRMFGKPQGFPILIRKAKLVKDTPIINSAQVAELLREIPALAPAPVSHAHIEEVE